MTVFILVLITTYLVLCLADAVTVRDVARSLCISLAMLLLLIGGQAVQA